MADEEAPATEPAPESEPAPAEERAKGEGPSPVAENSPDDKKDPKPPKKKTWEDKRKSYEKKQKLQYMPFGSDPCIKLRTKKDRPKSELTSIKGSSFPWYESIRKTQDIVKEKETKEAKEKKKVIKAGENRFKEMIKAHKEYLKNLSEQVRRRREYEANKEPNCKETYEEYVVRREKRKRAREIAKKNEEKLRKQEAEAEKKYIEEMEGKKGTKKGQTKSGMWPGSYPISVTQDFITMLKLIIEAEYETKRVEKRKVVIKPSSKKDRIIKEFSSFLDVLFTANEMMKKKAGCGGPRAGKSGELGTLDSSEIVTEAEESEGKPEEEEVEEMTELTEVTTELAE